MKPINYCSFFQKLFFFHPVKIPHMSSRAHFSYCNSGPIKSNQIISLLLWKPICFLTLFIIQVEYCQSSRTEYHRIRVSLNQEHIQDFNFRETGLNGLYNPCIIALKVTSVLSKHNRQRCLLRAIFF